MITQSSIYLFNPENDLAVGVGTPHYTPPPAAQKIAADLSLLPVWYGNEGDCVLSLAAITPEMETFVKGITVFPISSVISHTFSTEVMAVPWGWSHYAKNKLRECNLPLELPSDETLEILRQLSHRQVTISILQRLENAGIDIPSLPRLLTHAHAVRQFVEEKSQRMLKAPWSGSGKGLYWGRGEYDTPLERWSNGILRRQGVLLGEDVVNKSTDFAMEFNFAPDGVQFVGYSLFVTDEKGVYKGNVLTSDEEIEKVLTGKVSRAQLLQLQCVLENILQDIIGSNYWGYMGVDMMIYQDATGSYRIHPCVELNLRMNMGMVARLFYDKWVHPQSEGRYFIDFEKAENILLNDHTHRQQISPLVIVDGKIKQGYLSLCSINATTQYRARVEIITRNQ